MAQRSSRWLGAGLALLLALLQFRLDVLLLRERYDKSVDAALGVLDGHPHWRVYQSRVLSPHIVQLFSWFSPSFQVAHEVFSVASLAVIGILAWRLGHREAGRRGALLALVVAHASFALCVAPPWLYCWDYGNVIVFLLFVDFVVLDRPWWWFAALGIIGTLNHEIALFVSVWLVVDPLACRWLREPRSRPATHVIAGVVGVVAGCGLVEGLRRALLVEEIGPKIFADVPKEAGAPFLQLKIRDNIALLFHALDRGRSAMPLVLLVGLVGVLVLAVTLAGREPRRFGGLAITYATILASLFAFGLFGEVRIYSVLVPLVILGAVRLTS